LLEYLDREQVEQALVVRRLDALAETVGQLQHDIDVIGQVLAVYVKYAFLTAPAATTRDSQHRAEVVFGNFLAMVASQLEAGARLTGEVFRARSGTPSGSGGPKPGGGQP
jgi:hypothetical protein